MLKILNALCIIVLFAGSPSAGPVFLHPEYAKAAINKMLHEANNIAYDLKLNEKLPIKEELLVSQFVVPYEISIHNPRALGSVSTINYAYNFPKDHKLGSIERTDQIEKFRDWITITLPLSDINTNSACNLAIEYLEKAKMDAVKMKQELSIKVMPDPTYNSYNSDTNRVVPIYLVSFHTQEQIKSGGGVAYIRLMLPSGSLISLVVKDPTYILRPAVVFTNISSLLKYKQ